MFHLAISSPPPVIAPLRGRSERCLLIPDFLSAEECRVLIAAGERRGFSAADGDYPPSYRNNARQVIDHDLLAASLFERMGVYAPATVEVAGEGAWRLDSINTRFRCCRYRAGQRFAIHQDGVHHRDADRRSYLTFMIYLNDAEEFEGGDTVFYAAGPESGPEPVEIGRVRPRAGSLILFDHSLWHAGAEVEAGSKYILRSDVLYRREISRPPSPPAPFEPAHRGYVWTMERLGAELLASGGRDATIRLWSTTGEARGELRGHSQSVLGLAALSPDRLISVSRDRSLRRWDIASGRSRSAALAHDTAILTVAALDADHFATGAADGSIKLWNGDLQATGTLPGHDGWVWALVAAGPERLASAGEDGQVKIWDWRRGECVAVLPGGETLRALAVSPCGRWLARGDQRGRMEWWESADGSAWQRRSAWSGHEAAIRRLRFLDGGTLASASEDKRVRLWRIGSTEPFHEAEHANFVTDVLALDGQDYLSCAYDGTIRVRRWRG